MGINKYNREENENEDKIMGSSEHNGEENGKKDKKWEASVIENGGKDKK